MIRPVESNWYIYFQVWHILRGYDKLSKGEGTLDICFYPLIGVVCKNPQSTLFWGRKLDRLQLPIIKSDARNKLSTCGNIRKNSALLSTGILIKILPYFTAM